MLKTYIGYCYVDKTGTRLMNAIQCVSIGFVLKTYDGVFLTFLLLQVIL